MRWFRNVRPTGDSRDDHQNGSDEHALDGSVDHAKVHHVRVEFLSGREIERNGGQENEEQGS